MVDELMRLAMRLKGPFNIENVVVPIDVKISDAIMTFQENAETITDKVNQLSHLSLSLSLSLFVCLSIPLFASLTVSPVPHSFLYPALS